MAFSRVTKASHAYTAKKGEMSMSDEKRGYEITHDSIHNILKLRVWGFWDKVFAEKFFEEWKQEILTVSANGRDWYSLIDARQFSTQEEDVQEVMHQSMTYEKEQGVKKVARLVGAKFSKFQIERLTKEHELDMVSVFGSEEDAIAWLLNE